jgi:hypothetical protein
MLSLLISIPIIGLALWLILRIAVSLSKKRAGPLPWITFIAIILAGGYVGFQLAHYDLRVSSTFRWIGVPMPVAFFQLEGEHWTDFVPPSPIQWLNLITDTFIPIIVLLFPWMVALQWCCRKRHKEH